MIEEVVAEATILSKDTLVCKFNGLWPHLVDLYSCIMNNWRPLLDQGLAILPLARVFFVVAFETPQDRTQILDIGPWV